MKKCFKCGLEKSLSDFYKHLKMSDGHLNKCKDCSKNDVHINYKKKSLIPEYIEKERKRGRIKYRKLYVGTGKAKPQNNKKWLLKFPEKWLAYKAATHLKKPNDNNHPLVEKHHWSYNEQHYKDVIWILKREHMKCHRFLVYDQERKMYRRFDTNELLDTKERHCEFIEWCIKNKED